MGLELEIDTWYCDTHF